MDTVTQITYESIIVVNLAVNLKLPPLFRMLVEKTLWEITEANFLFISLFVDSNFYSPLKELFDAIGFTLHESYPNNLHADSNDIPGGDKRKTWSSSPTNSSANGIEQTNEIIANSNGTSGRVSAETIPEKSDNLMFYVTLGCFCGLVTVVLIVIFNSSFVHSYLGLNKLRLSRDSVE